VTVVAPAPRPVVGEATRGPSLVVRCVDQLAWLGRLVVFALKTFCSIPLVLVRHRGEVYRLLADVTFGGGLLAVAASTVLVVFVIAAFVGITIGLEGYQGLQIIGLAPLAGYLSSYANTREIAPLITAFGLAAQMGCKFTTQLGAMRINEEIDALEVIGIRTIPYLASTRLVAGVITVGPLYCIAVLMSFLAARFGTTVVYGQSTGVYDHYFHTFLDPIDLLWSFVSAFVMAVVVMLVHTYYGYTAHGGPAGVGEAVGRAVRASLVIVVLVTLMVSLSVYGQSGNFHLSG
jgi:phospholipid/cholesterol/gamma-HCH transport system permease protein